MTLEGRSEADREIRDLADRLAALQQGLGAAYWETAEVHALQATLQDRLGTYGAWSADKLPTHQRARAAARYESEFAPLLWPR